MNERTRSRRGVLVALAVAVASGACTAPAATPVPSPSRPPASAVVDRATRWAEDVAMVVGRMRELHPDLFHGVSDASFDAATDALRAALPTMSDDQVLVGLMRLVASISAEGRDGHMGIWPPDNPGAVRRYPVRLWEFPDGLYVTAAMPPGADLVGGRVLAVNGRPLAEVERLLDPVVPRVHNIDLS